MSSRLASFVSLVVAALVVGGCQAPTVDDLAAVASEVDAPAQWRQTGEQTVARCADPVQTCPRIVVTYDVPADNDFATSATSMLEASGLTVTGPAVGNCDANPEPACSVRSRRDDVAVRATVTGTAGDRYTVSVRITEHVGS